MIKKNYFNIFLTIFCALFFLSGCVASSHLEPPKWFLSIPKDNVNLYGNGTGQSLETSKQNAFNDLASNLKIKINANTTLKNTQNNQTQNTQIEQNIHITLDSMELQNITLTHSQYKNNLYYTQVKVSKKSILDNLQNQYNTLYQKLSAFNQNHCKAISIQDKTSLENLLNSLVSIKQTIDSLDEFISLPSLKIYQNLLAQNSPLPKAKLLFNPQAPKELIVALSAEYAKFIQNSDEQNIPIIKNDLSIQKIDGKIKLSLKLDLYDCQNNVVFHTQIYSIQSEKANALNRLAVQLYKKLKAFSNAELFSIPNIE